jgi:protein gp37
MGAKTGISWTHSTWNFIRGCSLISEECVHCYAMIMAARFSQKGGPYEGIATRNKGGKPMWTGKIGFYEDKLRVPVSWQKPRLIFVNSMSDLFHENLEVEYIRRGLDVMAEADWHIYQVLTKRASRMADVMSEMVLTNGRHLGKDPLPNVWFGTSVGLEKTAHRIADLARTPAAIRFVSGEPLIGHVDWRKHLRVNGKNAADWVIFGGESQTGSRDLPVDSLREGIAVCKEYGIAAYNKQMGDNYARAHKLKDQSGSDIDEWEPEFRVQNFPIDVDKALEWDGKSRKKTKGKKPTSLPLDIFETA